MPTAHRATVNRGSIMGLTQRRPMSPIMGVRRRAMKDGADDSGDTQFAQIIRAAPFAARNETPLLPVCCLCRLIRDESGPALDRARWVTQRAYRKTHGVNPADCLHTHTYCSGCFTQVMGTLKATQVMTTPAVA